MPRYFIDVAFVVNAVVVTDSTFIRSRLLIGAMTSRHVAIIGTNFEILRSREMEKSDSR